MEGLDTKFESNQNTSPHETTEKPKVEISYHEGLAYSRAMEYLPCAIQKSVGSFVYLDTDSATKIEDALNFRPKKHTTSETINRWLSYYLNKHEKPDKKVYPGRNIAIEEISDSSNFDAYIISNGAKCLTSKEDSTSQEKISNLEALLKESQSITKKFGLSSDIPGYLVVFSPQVSLDYSTLDQEEKTVIIGDYNPNKLESDNLKTAVHEITHAYFEETSICEGVDLDSLFSDNFLSPSLIFFSEGVAVLSQDLKEKENLVSNLRENYSRIPEKIREQIETGNYSSGRTLEEKDINWELYTSLGLDQSEITSAMYCSTRIFPAVFTLYCIEMGIDLKSIIKTQLNQFEPIKKEIASKYNIDENLINASDITVTLENIEKMNPDLFPRSLPVNEELVKEIDDQYAKAYLKPFEIIGIIMDKSKLEVSKDFFQWMNK